ncbi:MAG: LysE family translocator [Actinomycetota bacterium]
MPSVPALLTFAALALAIIVVPGPSVLFIISRAVALGRRAALLTVVGNAAGVYVQVIIVALGLGALLERSIAAYTVVKLAGAAYLVWLGVQAIRHRGHQLTDADVDGGHPTRTVLAEGFVVGVTNPKTIALLAAVFPQFVVPDGAPAGLQMAVLGLVFVAVALVADSVWGLAAGTARAWVARSPRRLSWLGAGGGAVMIALGAQLALTGRRD